MVSVSSSAFYPHNSSLVHIPLCPFIPISRVSFVDILFHSLPPRSLTPGTLKYAGPAGHWSLLSMKRNIVDCLVEGLLTHVFTWRCLLAPEVTPNLVIPLACCGIYEFVFDYGQHMHTYGTQNLHVFVCMCFPVAQGQIIGIQLFLTLLYVGSGFCKLGSTFPHMFTMNLSTSKPMTGFSWNSYFMRKTVPDYDKSPPNYCKSKFAYYLANGAALIEFLNCSLLATNNWWMCWLSIVIFICMHTFIIATLSIDVFCWNFTDALAYIVLYGILHTGIAWEDLNSIHPLLATWLVLHACYAVYGHYFPDHVPVCFAHLN